MTPTMRARQLRQAMTPWEARLRLELRALRAQGFHFRRQAPLRGYFLDFVCFSHRLAIELDGGQHSEAPQAGHDAVRDQVLLRSGFRTLRFWNVDINTNLDGVVFTILHALGAIGERSPTRPALCAVHPPHEGEGGNVV